MKGFYITVKNGLLDPKHIKAMGGDRDIGTIWLFLWLLDKMTIVNDEIGEGKVLGGKPIKYDEIKKDLGISRSTYKRWIKMLKDGHYIKTVRTPYGLSITVFKAFKIFGQKTIDGSLESHLTDGSLKTHQKKRWSSEEPSNSSSGEPSNKTIQLDNTDISTTNVVDTQKRVYGNPDINKVIDFLKEKIEGSLDGSQKQNRQYANFLLKRMKKDYPQSSPTDLVCRLVDLGLKDDFHKKNITSFKYLYYNAQKIIQSSKNKIKTPIIL